VSKDRETKIVMTSGGVPLTEADLDRLADEAERGYDVSQIKPLGPGTSAFG
jgi:hypothetical protein